MAEMFGAPEGASQAVQDNLRMSQMAIGPAHARLYSAQAGAAEEKLQQSREMARLMQGMDWSQPSAVPGQPPSHADPLYKLSDIALRAGDVTQSRQLLNTASQISSREQSSITATARANLINTRAQILRLEQVSGALSAAPDEASKKVIYEAATGLQWVEGADKVLEASLTTANNRLKDATLSSEYESRAELRTRRIAEMDALDRHRLVMEGIAAARDARLAKTGAGKAIAAPTSAETDAAKFLIMQQIPGADQADAATIVGGAKYIAASAKSMRRENPALDWNTALQRALLESHQAGDWQSVSQGFGTKLKFQGGGKTADTAVPIPMSKNAVGTVKIDRDKLTKGKFYTNPTRQVAQWTGTGFSPVAVAPSGSASSEADEGDEPDSDEDD